MHHCNMAHAATLTDKHSQGYSVLTKDDVMYSGPTSHDMNFVCMYDLCLNDREPSHKQLVEASSVSRLAQMGMANKREAPNIYSKLQKKLRCKVSSV